ncbi:hypothetical protein M9H77_16642 [Catharanthus roseus]|uniref:Uncharacterized protein n=1 Tax=Catharanthus roseus TaxID=4058 RepID=A0ACC0B2C2_CATRO|nr:hypothetical protein M9H77_16642 [Catharanthus roseus]
MTCRSYLKTLQPINKINQPITRAIALMTHNKGSGGNARRERDYEMVRNGMRVSGWNSIAVLPKTRNLGPRMSRNPFRDEGRSENVSGELVLSRSGIQGPQRSQNQPRNDGPLENNIDEVVRNLDQMATRVSILIIWQQLESLIEILGVQ